MFDTPDLARVFLAEHFSPPQIEIVIEALEPGIQFRPLPDGALTPGSTRIGGTPDLPTSLEWPVPEFPANIAEITTRGSPEANEEMKQHIALRLPYAFFAQVDLSEAKTLGNIADDLPGDGRLLFFYDLIIGPYGTGTWSGRVIWDRSPVEMLEHRPLPETLEKASGERRAFYAELDKQYGNGARSPDAGTPYEARARAMQLSTTLRPPAAEAIEIELYPALKSELAKPGVNYEETFSGCYEEVFGLHFDPYYDAANRGHRNQLLGGPLPEQSDPRYDAVVAAEYGGRHFSPEEWDLHAAEIAEKAKAWRLLLQIDVADWMQDNAEGTVYFLIRADDLREHRFDRVIPVYQQT